MDYYRTGKSRVSCIWAKNCPQTFLGVDPKGNAGQCHCWVASYPDYVFGNILTCLDMADIMNSPVRQQLLDRPMRLMEEEDCAECEFLAICHGGCPIRAYSATGSLFTKDPYCESSRTLFRLARDAARDLDRLESTRPQDSAPALVS